MKSYPSRAKNVFCLWSRLRSEKQFALRALIKSNSCSRLQPWPRRRLPTQLCITSVRKAFGRDSVGIVQMSFTIDTKDPILGDAVVVNPEISSGLPLQGVNRFPPPGSRPEKYSTPATKGATICVLSSSSASLNNHILSFRYRSKPLLETRRPTCLPPAFRDNTDRLVFVVD